MAADEGASVDPPDPVRLSVEIEETADLSTWEVGSALPPPACDRWRLDGDGWLRLDRPDGSFFRCRIVPAPPPRGGAP